MELQDAGDPLSPVIKPTLISVLLQEHWFFEAVEGKSLEPSSAAWGRPCEQKHLSHVTRSRPRVDSFSQEWTSLFTNVVFAWM